MTCSAFVVRVLVTEYDRPHSIYPLAADNRIPVKQMSCLVELDPHWIQLSTSCNGAIFINQISLSEHLQRNGHQYGLQAASFNCRIIDDQAFTNSDLYEVRQIGPGTGVIRNG